MARRADSGTSEPYDDVDEAELEAALDDAWNDYDGTAVDEPATGDPTTMRVNAQVEWSGVIDRARDGQRTVNLDGLDLGGVRDALTAARKASSAASSAGSSLHAKGWKAQLGELFDNPRGQRAADRVGLSPAPQTVLRWLAGDQAPNKANEQRIAAAYRDVRDQVAGEARSRAERARHELANQVSSALQERYGSEIRLRRITSIELG
jgi:hypothetical protein